MIHRKTAHSDIIKRHISRTGSRSDKAGAEVRSVGGHEQERAGGGTEQVTATERMLLHPNEVPFGDLIGAGQLAHAALRLDDGRGTALG